MSLVVLRGVSRIYSSSRGPSVQALRGIDLEIAEGEFVAIVGPSGGGKTTLLNILGLLDDPTAGEYVLDGDTVQAGDGKRSASVRSAKVGFVFQAFHLLEGRPAIDSVELGLLYRGASVRIRSERAWRALETVELGDRAAHSTSNLSGGQRQRVAIARAIASDAQLILADEPTGNLDSRNAVRVLDELERLNASGATIVVVTHSPEVAARARRIVHIADGVLISDATHPDARLDRDAERSAGGSRAPVNLSDLGQATSARIRVADLLRDAWASVLSRRFQTLGQSFAVAIAVALTIVTLGLSTSATAQVSATFDAHLNREVTASWIAGVSHSPPLHEVPARADDVRGVDAAAVVYDLGPTSVSTFADAREVRPHVAAGDIASAARLTIDEAPWHQGTLKSDQVYVGDLLATQLHLSDISRAPAITINGDSFGVAGIITQSPRLPLLRGEVIIGSDADASIGAQTEVTLLVITAAGAAQQVAKQLPGAVNPFLPDQIYVTAPTDSATLRNEIEQGVQAALTAFTVLALVVAIAALMNATLLAVHARRGEIGMRKAVGARDGHIGALITVESAYIGLLGGAAGLVFGMAAILAVTIVQRWTPVFDIHLLPVALLVGLIVGAGGGGLAAIRAARLRPAENLRG